MERHDHLYPKGIWLKNKKEKWNKFVAFKFVASIRKNIEQFTTVATSANSTNCHNDL